MLTQTIYLAQDQVKIFVKVNFGCAEIAVQLFDYCKWKLKF